MPVSREKAFRTIGETAPQMKIIKKRSKKIPHLSKKFSTGRKLIGKIENKTLDPSSGGIGIILNKARIKLVKTMIEAML